METRTGWLAAGWLWDDDDEGPKPLHSTQENTVNTRWQLPVCVQTQTQVWARRIKKDFSLERNDWAFCNFEGPAWWPLPPTAIARSFIYTVFRHAWWQPLSMCKRSPQTGCTLWPDTGLCSGLRVKLFLRLICQISQTNHWTLTSAAPHRRRASVQWLTQGGVSVIRRRSLWVNLSPAMSLTSNTNG